MISHSLYNGEVQLDFDEVKHKYFYNGEIVEGVTTITDAVLDKSGAISGWALNQAEKYLRDKWPIDGYVPLGSPEFDSLIKGMKAARFNRLKKAANTGTDAHAWVEAWIKSQWQFLEAPTKPTDPQALYAVNAFLEYVDQNHIIFKASEQKIFSRTHLYAGTLDIIAIINGVYSLLDIKTSNSFRIEYALQTAGYLGAYNEEHSTSIDNRIILMLPKDGESTLVPVVRGPATFNVDFNAFLKALDLYRWSKAIKE